MGSPNRPQEQAMAVAEERAYARVVRRLMPFLFLFYTAAYLDRINIGFAKVQMLSELRWTDTIYGFGAGMFFIGYFIFEIPSNLILLRVGAKRWISFIMAVWGLLSAAMVFVHTPVWFYLLRFALGLAEAGFYPGIILYLTMWFPSRRRGRIVATLWTAIGVSGVVGGPLSGWIMQSAQGIGGLSGWQWLFLVEGLPSVGLALVVLIVLDDSIRKSHWLTEEEKVILETNIAAEERKHPSLSKWQVLAMGRVWLLSLIYFLFVMGLYGVGFWLPQIIKNTGVSNLFHVGLLTAIPYGVAIVAMVVMGKRSDRTGERRRHIALSALTAAIGFVISGLYGDSTLVAMFGLVLATAGSLTALPLFWTLPTEFLGGMSAAVGIGLINSIGNLAGFASPYLVGAIRDATHSTAIGLYVIAGSMTVGAVLVVTAVKPRQKNPSS